MQFERRKRGRPKQYQSTEEATRSHKLQKTQYECRNRSPRNRARRRFVSPSASPDIQQQVSIQQMDQPQGLLQIYRAVDENQIYYDNGNMDVSCSHCGGLSFRNEIGRSKNSCCHGGKIKAIQLTNYPESLYNLLVSEHETSRHFRENIRVYNNAFAFASFNCKTADTSSSGPYSMRIIGERRAKVTTSLLANGNPRYGQIYIYDDNETVSFRSNLRTRGDVLLTLQEVMKNNPYAKKYKQLYDVFKNTAEKIISLNFLSYPGDDQRRYNMPMVNEVAAVIISKDGEIPTSVDVKVFPESEKYCDFLSITSHHADPMLFPLIFPNGSHGWDYRMKTENLKNLSPLQFYSSRLTDRGNFNPVLSCGRLTQQYIINCYLVVESQRLKFHRLNQDKLRTEFYQGLVDHLTTPESNFVVGNRLVLPGTYQGSPRSLHLLYQDAMAICRKIGRPDLFITMTCNPKWPEITRYLQKFPKGSTASDIPHFTSRLFYQKMSFMLKDLESLFGSIVAYVYTVEFQKRGLPHVHLLVTLAKKLLTSDDVDKFIIAEIPNRSEYPRLWYKVTKHMLHGPHSKNTPCYNTDTKICKKKFPKPFADRTDMSGNGFPVYRRRNNSDALNTYHGKSGNKIVYVNNSMVVPYNPYLLMKYDCHINVEYCASVMSIKYIHKYIHKGHDRAKIAVRLQDGSESIDEIQDYLDTRYLSANESAWRLFELPLHGKSHSVERLPIHLPGKNRVIFVEGKVQEAVEKNIHSKLTAYFELNKSDSNAQNLKYEDIPKHYRWIDKEKKWNLRINHCATVSRLVSISSKATELFHLKILLRKISGAKSFDDLKTVNGIVVNSFREAATLLGYVRSETEFEEVMEEAASTLMPSRLRHFFVYMLLGCTEINAVHIWDKFKINLSEDCDEETAKIRINSLLLKENYSLATFGITCDTRNAATDECSPVNIEEHNDKFNDMFEKLNTEQKVVFNAVFASISGDVENNCFYIDGPGGSGKTFLYKCLVHKALSLGKKVISIAWTGIAAILLPFGKTAHKSFQLPLNVNELATLYWDLSTKKLLKETDVFLWDEASMIPRCALESIDIAMRDTCGSQKCFGGKIFLLGGDFRQVLPVVKKGGKAQIIDATIKNSILWPSFTQFALTKNMRAASGETQFCEWLLSVGDGEIEELVVSEDMKADDIVTEMYGNCTNNEEIVSQAILTTRNDIVAELNMKILQLLPGQITHCEGIDSVTMRGSDGTDNASELLYPLEYINTLTPSGFPPQSLKLKKGAIVMLLRNLCVHDGLCNGTRLIILDIKKYIIHCRILTGDHAGELVTLPRIKLDSSADTELPFVLHRTQFPVRLSFAMTINKSQGQTFDRVGVYLTNNSPIFSHGQLYVALSRCRAHHGIRIQIAGSSKEKSIKNIVYKEIL